MDHYIFIQAFGVLSLMGWYGSAKTTKKLIKEIGYHKKYYPKKYIMPNRIIRKIFNLTKREIPKFLYAEFFMSFVYIILFVVSGLMLLILANKALIAYVFFDVYIAILSVDVFHILIYLILYKFTNK